METGKEFNALLQVLSGEQQILQRTDQKAFTLLSILGVFMVFFMCSLSQNSDDCIDFYFHDGVFHSCNGYHL